VSPQDPDLARLAAARPRRVATFITTVLDPINVVAALLVLVCLVSRTTWSEFGKVLLVVLVGTVAVPKAILAVALRRGHASDRQVVRRSERPLLAAGALVSVVATIVALVLMKAPRPVFALLVAMGAGLLLVLVATLWTKASLHAAVLAGSLPVLWSWSLVVAAVVGLVALPCVMWARVNEGRHTRAQVLLGALLGVVGGLIFPFLM